MLINFFYFQMLLSNLTGVQFAAGGAGGFVPVMPLYGNPGDYAWGRGGLDAVVTSLLNQMEGAGPPPMPTDNIGEIPKVKITSSQVGKLNSRDLGLKFTKFQYDLFLVSCFQVRCLRPP